MKKITKNLLTGIGLVSVGLIAYTLWDDYIQNEIRQKKKSDAEKIAAFIARRKAHAQAKRESAAENAEKMRQTEPAFLKEQAERQDIIADGPESSQTVQEAGTL